MPKIIVSADDFGLTVSISNSILQTVDQGVTRNVSILANGEAVAYAVDAYKKRSAQLSLSLHINLTEGPCIAGKDVVPLLVDAAGNFRFSVVGLWVFYFLSPKKQKQIFVQQIVHEVTAQKEHIERLLGPQYSFASINGHQHVHMVPCVFTSVASLAGNVPIRVPNEPLYVPNPSSFFKVFRNMLGAMVIAYLSERYKKINNVKRFSDFFVGIVYSGRMTYESCKQGLAYLAHSQTGAYTTEILFHPGCAQIDELAIWQQSRANTSWHFSQSRNSEQQLVKSEELKTLLSTVSQGMPIAVSAPLPLSTVLRYFISGTIVAATQFLVLYICTEWFGLWYGISAAVGASIAIILSFILQKFFTFLDYSTEYVGKQIVLFLVLNAMNIFITALLLIMFVEWFHMHYLLGELFTVLIVAALNFFMYRLIFKEH